MTVTQWPTHRRKAREKASRTRWAKRQAALLRRASAVKPNDRQRIKAKTPPEPELL